MTDAFPIFIGITGKRQLADDPAQAAEAEQKVRTRLAAVFDRIETMLPDNPKVLLTGAALGADLLAAEEALGLSGGTPRRNWLVLAVLPFETALFKQDFKSDEWTKFERVVADARTRTWILPPLTTADGTPANASDLERRKDATEDQKELRRRHYEQVGIWIADNANILLAVMPDREKAEKVGGTARIVACRRGGRPDAVAAEVIAASQVLMPRTELQRPAKGYVWLIDPDAQPLSKEVPVTVLPPIPGGAPQAQAYAEPGAHANVDQRTHLRESEALLDIAQLYVKDGRGRSPFQLQPQKNLQEWPSGSDPAQVVSAISGELRVPTNRAAARSRHAFYELVGLFLGALLAFEMFTEFLPDSPWVLLIYLLLLATIIGLYLCAVWGHWQPVAEDRRAIREVIRVQVAWWRAGLRHRVDQLHLQGADFDLARVRDAARNIIVWALLQCLGKEPAINWKTVFAPEQWPPFDKHMPGNTFPNDWIGNQYYYFRQREEQRETKGQLIDALSWSLFAAAGLLAVLLLVLLFLLRFARDSINYATFLHQLSTFSIWSLGGAVLICLAGACGAWWITGRLRHEESGRRLSIVFALVTALWIFVAIQLVAAATVHPAALWMHVVFFVLTLGYGAYWLFKVLPDANATHLGAAVLGIGAAILFAFVLQAGAAAVAHRLYDLRGLDDPHDPHGLAHVAEHMTIVFVVFLPALAGAMRFLADKLAVEAEALSYREARDWFEHATDLLLALKPGNGNAAADERARDIILRIGRLALSENEAWLKSRRERPLSPVIGG